MSKLKDSAILTLNDFARIRENSRPLPVYSSTSSNLPVSPKVSNFDENRYQKALYHKNKILEYDKKRKHMNTYILMKEIKVMIHIQKLADMMMHYKQWIKCAYTQKYPQ